MKTIELIRHYDRRIGAQRELSHSLSTKLVQLMEVFGHLPADSKGQDFEATAVKRWPTSTSTRRRMLSQLRAVLNVAHDSGLIQSVPKLHLPFVYDVRDVPITAQESQVLLDTLKWGEPRWYPLVLVLCHTGTRLNEGLRIDPRTDFTPAGTVLRKLVGRRTKTVARTVPYTARMREELCTGGALHKKLQDSCVLSLGRVGTGDFYSTCRSVASMLGPVIKTACESVGLPAIRVNDFRHVFAAIVASNGGDIADIASLLGHQNIAMSLRYRGLVQARATGILAGVT